MSLTNEEFLAGKIDPRFEQFALLVKVQSFIDQGLDKDEVYKRTLEWIDFIKK